MELIHKRAEGLCFYMTPTEKVWLRNLSQQRQETMADTLRGLIKTECERIGLTHPEATVASR